MKKRLFKSSLAIAILLLNPLFTFAAGGGGGGIISTFSNFVRTNAIEVLIALLIVGAISNIGKIFNSPSDWKGFFTNVGLFVAGVAILVAAVAYVGTMHF